MDDFFCKLFLGKEKPYYISKTSVIYNLDCLEVLSNIKENSIDMIFADPPYMPQITE